MTGTTVVILPGTGSDAHFAADAFALSVQDKGWSAVFVDPEPADVVAGYRAALADASARRGDGDHLVVGGISLGAAVAMRWVLDNSGAADAALLAMPAWSGAAAGSPAALSALATAAALREQGLEASIASMSGSSPAWLAATLTRSWRSQWPDLPTAMVDAAAFVSPTPMELTRVDIPVGLVAAIDDPVHPLEVADEWTRALPVARLATFDLAELGVDASVLGRLAVTALTSLWPAG